MARTNARRLFIRSVLLAVLATSWFVGDYFYRTRRYWRTPADSQNGFLVLPYVQLGTPSPADVGESVELLWHTFDDAKEQTADEWKVEFRLDSKAEWTRVATAPTFRKVAIPGVYPHRVYRARITNLIAGRPFSYRLARDGRVRFEAEAKPRPAPSQPSRAVVFGDFGSGSTAEARVASRVWDTRPDLVMLTGDLVYWRGRVGEYQNHFFPFFNAKVASPYVGAPLLRSTLFLAAPGNHDLMARDLDEDPDAQAFFYYWSMPLNGPVVAEAAPGSPGVKGSPIRLEKFREAAGAAYPRMANFSADVGDVHWTVIDLNNYADWSDPALLAWLERDLASAQNKPWRLVVGHQAGFQSGRAHCHEQQMRPLAPIFERHKVAVVFAGHVHNYQRSMPLKFAPKLRSNGRYANGLGEVTGDFTLDRSFDGDKNPNPDGVIYIVSGAGGAALHDTAREDQTANVNDFTVKFIADKHSFTLIDITPQELKLRQISDMGEELDRVNIRRGEPQVADSSQVN